MLCCVLVFYQILVAMSKDSGTSVSTLHVDGGMTVNSLLMQLQADIAGLPVGKHACDL